jgi:preprotein translocase subunit SecB
MAENDETGFAPQPNGADTAPQIAILGQYVKDLSFENPNAPAIYQQQAQPEIDVQFQIGVKPVSEEVHEVALTVTAHAKSGENTVFRVELVYAGLFGARNIEEPQLHPYLYAEAPRLLFPFARAIVADQIRDGAFPPLLLDPIDFGAMYQQQIEQTALSMSEPAGEA